MAGLTNALVLAAGAAILLTSCSTAPAEQAQSPRAAQKLADALEGRVAGPPQRCISNFPTTEVRVIDDWTILYQDGSTIYVQNPPGGCRGIASGTRTLVARQVGTSQMCEGDINEAVDLRSGVGGAPCVFGPFIPYTKPKP
jgi:hypothetical protein